MNIVSLLQNDHRNVETLVHGLQSVSDRRMRRQIFDELRAELELHALAVEEAVYPKHILQARMSVFLEGARIANQDILRLLNDMENMEADSEEWTRLVTDLKSMVSRQVQSEEENLLPFLENNLSNDELVRWGQNLLGCKEQMRKGPHSIAV